MKLLPKKTQLSSIIKTKSNLSPKNNKLFKNDELLKNMKLYKNSSMIKSISSFINSGMPVYAECGGLMYLCESIKIKTRKFKMTGIIKGNIEMYDKPIGRGYVELTVNAKHPWMDKGDVVKCHEFHYSDIKIKSKASSYGFKVMRGYGINSKHDGILYKNLVASYSHLRDTA